MLISTKASLQLLAMVSCCISGGSTVDSRNIDGRFYYFDDPQTFTNATKRCEVMGMELATTTTEADYQTLMGFARSHSISFWIGLQFNDSENSYQWINGPFMGVVNWGPNEPPYNPNRTCAFIGNEVRKWSTGSCSGQKHYICVDLSPVHVYTYWSNKISHSEAQQRCLQNKSTLPIIITKMEETRLNNFLDTLNLPGDEELWIGLSRDDTGGKYRWVDGKELVDWYGDVLSFVGSGQYVYIHSGIHFHATSSNIPRNYMCQTKTIKEQTSIYYELEAKDAYPLSLPRQELQVNTRIACARYCSRDKWCLKYTLDGTTCTTYGPVMYTSSTDGLYLYKKLI